MKLYGLEAQVFFWDLEVELRKEEYGEDSIEVESALQDLEKAEDELHIFKNNYVDNSEI